MASALHELLDRTGCAMAGAREIPTRGFAVPGHGVRLSDARGAGVTDGELRFNLNLIFLGMTRGAVPNSPVSGFRQPGAFLVLNSQGCRSTAADKESWRIR